MRILFTALLFLAGCASDPYVSGLRTAEVAPGHQEGRFLGKDAINLFYQSWRPQNRPTKAVVILVHGLKDHSSRYREAAEKMAAEGYAVYAFDNRGHGDSDGTRVKVDDFNDYVADLETFYDLVVKSEPGTPVFVFGHSMGGAIVTLFALNNSRPLAGIILSAPALKATSDIGGFLKFSTRVLGTIAPSAAVFELKDENFSRDPAVVQAGINDPLIYHKKAPAHTAKELLNAMDRIQERMGDMKTPFLILHGKKDRLTNPEGSVELYKKAASRDKALKLYPEAWHDLLHEPEKAEVLALIMKWLDWHTARPAPEGQGFH